MAETETQVTVTALLLTSLQKIDQHIDEKINMGENV
jgi:hypothetical protein